MNTTSSDIVMVDGSGKEVRFRYDRVAQLFKIQLVREIGGMVGNLDGIPIHLCESVKLVKESLDPYRGQKVLIVTNEVAQFADEIREVLGSDVKLLVQNGNRFLQY